MSREPIRHALLTQCGVEHGFGVRGAREPAGLRRPVQVHGTAVATLSASGVLAPREADVVVSAVPSAPVAVVTADCVPILAASRSGRAVAAIHAGWRGLAAGVVERGIEALRRLAPPGEPIVAVVGPRIGGCCYEVDAPVFRALEPRFGARVSECVTPTRPGHGRIELGDLVEACLADCGLEPGHRAVLRDVCTRCDAERFHSYRRDGSRSGRLVHHAAAAPGPNSRLDRGDSRI